MKNISAVIVLFNPNIQAVVRLFESLIKEVNYIVIVDNSFDTNIDLIRPFLGENLFSYVHNRNKNGIAGAHNRGIEIAIEKGADGVILFDQDSDPEIGIIEKLITDYMRLIAKGYKIAAIGPTPMNIQNNKEYKPRIDSRKTFVNLDDIINEQQLISSGKLIPKNVLFDVGLMEEQLFIDGVDSEWCWRAKNFGYSIAMSKNAKMLHMLGEGDKKILGLSLAITSSFRLYYQYRNYLILSRRNYVPIYWKINNGVKYLVKIVFYGIFVGEQSKNLTSIYKGIRDGLKKLKSHKEKF